MAWVCDTCVLLDVALGDPVHSAKSARKLKSLAVQGLVVCPVSFIELTPQFEGDQALLRKFLAGCGVSSREPWTPEDTHASAEGFHRYVQLKRSGQTSKRPVADLMIGGFATRFRGLVTRNPEDFKPFYSKLKLVEP